MRLVEACVRDGTASAWEEFIVRFRPVVLAAVRRVCRWYGRDAMNLQEDLVQEVFLKCARNGGEVLRRFKPRGRERDSSSFSSYLRVVAVNCCLDHLRSRYAPSRGGRPDAARSTPENPATLESVPHHVDLDHGVLLGEIDTALVKSLDGPHAARDRAIFWLYYRTGLSTAAIAAIPQVGLTAKGVESVVLRLTRVVRAALASPRMAVKETP